MAAAVNYVVARLVRRGMDESAPFNDIETRASAGSDNLVSLPNIKASVTPSAAFIVLSTLLVCICLFIAVGYAMSVVTTLTIAEDPSGPDPLLDRGEEFGDSEVLLDDPIGGVLRREPITSGIRRTIRHLRTQAGPLAPWRGLAMTICLGIAFVFIHGLTTGALVLLTTKILALNDHLVLFIVPNSVSILTALALAVPSAVWTHIVISAPSPLPWYRRLVRRRMGVFAAVWRPTILATAAELLLTNIVGTALSDIGAIELPGPDALETKIVGVRKPGTMGIILMLGVVMYLGIVVPAHIVLVRVQTSLLNDDERTIIPFDRTFGGRVSAKDAWGKDVLSIWDAWASFRRTSLRRFANLFLKLTALFFVGIILVGLVIGGEVAALSG